MFAEYDVIISRRRIADKKIPIGSRGTILQIIKKTGSPMVYLVEFVDNNHKTIEIAFVQEEDIEGINK